MEEDNESIRSCQSKLSGYDCNCEKCQEICICQECSVLLDLENKNKKTKMKSKMFRWKNKSQKEKVPANSSVVYTLNEENNMSKTQLEPLQESKKKRKFFRIKRKREPENSPSPIKNEKKKGIFKHSKKKPIQREHFDIAKEITEENNEMEEVYTGNDAGEKKKRSPLMRESSKSHSSYIASLEVNNEDRSQESSDKGKPSNDRDSSRKSKSFLKSIIYSACCCF